MGSWLIPKNQLGQAEASNADALPLKAQRSVDWDEMATPFRSFRIRIRTSIAEFEKEAALYRHLQDQQWDSLYFPLASVSFWTTVGIFHRGPGLSPSARCPRCPCLGAARKGCARKAQGSVMGGASISERWGLASVRLLSI